MNQEVMLEKSIGTLQDVENYIGGLPVAIDPNNRDYSLEQELRTQGFVPISKHSALAKLVKGIPSIDSLATATNEPTFDELPFISYPLSKDESQTTHLEPTPVIEKKEYELPQQQVFREVSQEFKPLHYRQSLEYKINRSPFSSNYSPLEQAAFTTPVTPYQRASSYIPRSRRYH